MYIDHLSSGIYFYSFLAHIQIDSWTTYYSHSRNKMGRSEKCDRVQMDMGRREDRLEAEERLSKTGAYTETLGNSSRIDLLQMRRHPHDLLCCETVSRRT